MSPRKLPVVSHKTLLRLLASLGYYVDRQRGSHIRLEKKFPHGHHAITVPAHREIAKGTLNDILERVALANQTSKGVLMDKLSQI